MVSKRDRPRLYGRNGVFPGTVLVNGFVAGLWRMARSAGAVTLTVEPFGKIGVRDRDAITDEARLMLAFAAPAGAAQDIRFAPARCAGGTRRGRASWRAARRGRWLAERAEPGRAELVRDLARAGVGAISTMALPTCSGVSAGPMPSTNAVRSAPCLAA